MKHSLTRTFSALSDPTRRAIVQMLGERDMTAGEIGARFEMSAPSVSHHLNVLKQAELVQAERNGQTIVYAINASVVQEFVAEVLRFFKAGANDQTPQSLQGEHGDAQ